LKEDGVEEFVCNAFDICITEAVNNVIKHAYKGDSSKYVQVNVKREHEFVEIQIIDEGSPRSSFVIPDLDYDPSDINNLPESGMGLYIMSQLMDNLDYFSVNGKNYFTLKKYLV
jgi:serine/threonine-protein kinase RsbW